MAWRYEVVERAHRPSLPMTTHTDGDKENRLNIPSDFFSFGTILGFCPRAGPPAGSISRSGKPPARSTGRWDVPYAALAGSIYSLSARQPCVCVCQAAAIELFALAMDHLWLRFSGARVREVNHLARLADRPPGYR
jgi:hypothetical protein